MNAITAALARARVDQVFPGHYLTPPECHELATLWEKNDEHGLFGKERERCEALMEMATSSRYCGPDERN